MNSGSPVKAQPFLAARPRNEQKKYWRVCISEQMIKPDASTILLYWRASQPLRKSARLSLNRTTGGR
jgi:hypothetical protein